MIRCQLQKENSYGKWQKTEKVFSMLKCLLLPVPTLTILFAMLGAWACIKFLLMYFLFHQYKMVLLFHNDHHK